MGKPFKKELERIKETVNWSNGLDLIGLTAFLKSLNGPIYIVGSGGSFSACHFAVELLQNNGHYAKAITPLELIYLESTLRKSTVIFISASGRNSDIKFAFKRAIKKEPIKIGIITMKVNSPLAELASKHGIASIFEFENKVGKDGFLATNSLIAYFIILYRTLAVSKKVFKFRPNSLQNQIAQFIEATKPEFVYSVLYSGWGKPIALDIESKCSEAALCPTLLSDFRNFGHGRHHWFAKRKNSAIIALSHPKDSDLAKKTLNILPESIPKLTLSSKEKGAIASIDLLIQSFYLIEALGIKMKIDPGQPGVPNYGRKLYNLSYTSLFSTKVKSNLKQKEYLAIKRKTGINSIDELSPAECKTWSLAYRKFVKKINTEYFGMILFDYDGTLCNSSERFTGLSKEIIDQLKSILKAGYLIGIVTGRGQSVRKELQKSIPKKHWSLISVGYYNGAEFGPLSSNIIPRNNSEPDASLISVDACLSDKLKFQDVEYSFRPKQISIQINNPLRSSFVQNLISHSLKTRRIQGIQILESSHSVDIIPNNISKLDIIPFCLEKLKKDKKPCNILRIGDKGLWSGNDFILLDSSFGLSVDEVSPKFETCWNLASLGNRNTFATIEYLKLLKFTAKGMQFKYIG